MNSTRDTGSESLIKLGKTLADVTRSLKERNDALERHLVQTGWTIRRMNPKKPETKESNRP
jgi:hypothetical protein